MASLLLLLYSKPEPTDYLRKIVNLISHLLQQIVVEEGVPLPPISEDDQEVGSIPVKSPEHHLLPILPKQHVRSLLRVLAFPWERAARSTT